MHQMKTDLDGAMKCAAEFYSKSRRKFLEGLKKVPSWGEEIDIQVQQYLNGIACWPQGNYCWSFESGRYFGNKGLEYQRTRLVPLLPKVNPVGGDAKDKPKCVSVYIVEEMNEESEYM